MSLTYSTIYCSIPFLLLIEYISIHIVQTEGLSLDPLQVL